MYFGPPSIGSQALAVVKDEGTPLLKYSIYIAPYHFTTFHHKTPDLTTIVSLMMSSPRPGPSSLNVNINAAQNCGRSQPSSPTSPLYQTSSSPKPKGKGENYVYFDRQPQDNFSADAVARATAAKLKLESYYKVAVDAAIERNSRCVK